jgi:23S rRNA (guanine745-N1)-methyltransferase
VFRCPVCKEALAEAGDGRTWGCGAGHVYDVAREGYVNLLITHQRRQRDPGDSAEMLQHRRAFLEAGHYGALAEAVAAHARPGQEVLDAGCGEGYYTRTWPGRFDGLELWAVDIAKPAVRMAAKRARSTGQPRSHYAVGSVYDLPVVDASIDLAVSVFAPLHSPEFERVLRPGGTLVTVTPGPDHLAGLKARLFAEPEVHPDTGPFEREGATTTLEPQGTERVRADLVLERPGTVDDLLNMTPYAWYVGADVRAAVVAGGPLETPIDFLVSTYRRG